MSISHAKEKKTPVKIYQKDYEFLHEIRGFPEFLIALKELFEILKLPQRSKTRSEGNAEMNSAQVLKEQPA